MGAGLADEVGRISGNTDDLVPGLLENADDPLADEQLVFPDDDAEADKWTLSYSRGATGRSRTPRGPSRDRA